MSVFRLAVIGVFGLAIIGGMAISQAQPPTSGTPVPASSFPTEIVSTAITKNLAVQQRAPGVAVVIVQKGSVVYAQGFGVRDAQSQINVDVDTHFEIGSVTKQFTAAAILQLKEGGKLRLTDHLSVYVPEYPQAKDVTIEQLLWQVSGIPDYLNDVPNAGKLVTTTPGGLDAALALIKDMPLHFEPGTHFNYSNTNYLLLGAIVERVSHIPLDEYIRKNIFVLAGMNQSAFVKDENTLPDMATGYYGRNKDGGLVLARTISDQWAGGGGAIVSTVSDLAKWDEAFFSGTIVNSSDVALATTPYHLPSGDADDGYGFGWFNDSLDGHPRVWHGGESLGFSSINTVFPGDGLDIIVLENMRNTPTSSIATAVFETLHPDVAANARIAAPGEDTAVTLRVKRLVTEVIKGTIPASELSPAAATWLTPQLRQESMQFAAFGEPQDVVFQRRTESTTDTTYVYRIDFTAITMNGVIMVNKKTNLLDLIYFNV